MKLKELAGRPDLFTGGHRACAGCGFPILIRMVMNTVDTPIVVASSTGCLSVTTALYPYSSWRVPFIHSAFENAAATISGVEAAYRTLKRRGKLEKEIRFIAFGGDGGTYDIGLQSLSGAMERGHRILYICYDNGAYANTGIQRSSATPRGANTTTTPVGKRSSGKNRPRKNLTYIMADHGIPYVAQAAISHWHDLMAKTKKALNTDGPSFINVMAPCRLSWGNNPQDTVDLVEEAVNSTCWPLFEVENGAWRLNFKPKTKTPYSHWLSRQTRFRHLFHPTENEELLQDLQAEVDRNWEELLQRCHVENS